MKHTEEIPRSMRTLILGGMGILIREVRKKWNLNRYSKGELYTEAGVELPDEIRQKEEEREIDILLKL